MNPRIRQTPQATGPNKIGPAQTGKTRTTTVKGPTPAELLARMPRRPLTPEQQAAALEKVQQQATQRIKLGQQLFEAADAKLKQHQQLLKDIQDQQQGLREQVQEDVAKSLQSYDQWMGKIDESFTGAVKKLNERIDQLELRVDASRGELESMIEKATALMSQTQGLLAEAFDEDAAQQHAATPNNAAETDAGAPDDSDDPDAHLASEMQQSIPEDPHCDVDALGTPPIRYDAGPIDDSAYAYEADPEVLEVEIVDPEGDAPAENADQPPVEIDASALQPPRANDGKPKKAIDALDSDASFADDAFEPDLHDASAEDDVFGEVLRRLREQAEQDDRDAAA